MSSSVRESIRSILEKGSPNRIGTEHASHERDSILMTAFHISVRRELSTETNSEWSAGHIPFADRLKQQSSDPWSIISGAPDRFIENYDLGSEPGR